MRNFVLVLLFTGISTHEVIAQTLSAGYIINLRKDTLRGFIKEGIDTELESTIEFTRENSSSGLVKYSTSELLGFGFDYGRTFERFSKPSDTKNPGDSVLVFAKKNIAGKVRLYTVDVSGSNQPDMVLVNTDSHRKVYLSEPKKKYVTVEKEEQKIFLVNAHLGLLAYVKGEPAIASQRINYTEKAIRKDILNYNNQYTKDFPVAVYKPRVNYFYDVTLGMPVIKGSGSEFRTAIYRNKHSPETSRRYSTWIGVSYRYWSSNAPPSNVPNTNQNYRQQFISVIPLGLNFHTGSGIIRPYIYFGLGLVCFLETNYNIVNYVDYGSKTEFGVFPTFNPGAGVKIKIASQFLMIEVTPSAGSQAIFMNVGWSF